MIPFDLPETHPLVQSLMATQRRVLGGEVTARVNPAWSDACYLSRFAGVPAVTYGAGTPGQAHTAAEYADTWRIVDCTRVLASFLYERLHA